MKRKKIACAVIYSGGKDGHLALLRALGIGRKVSCLLHIDGGRRHAEHFNDLRKLPALRLHSRLSGIPLFVWKAGPGFDPKRMETAFAGLLGAARKRYAFDEVFCGASGDDEGATAAEVAAVSSKLGISIVTPLGKDRLEDSVREMGALGVKAAIIGVDRSIPAEWLGKPLDMDLCRFIRSMRRRGIRIGGNEIQTVVTASPVFKGELCLEKARVLGQGKNIFWSFSVRCRPRRSRGAA